METVLDAFNQTMKRRDVKWMYNNGIEVTILQIPDPPNATTFISAKKKGRGPIFKKWQYVRSDSELPKKGA
ncbi:MAG: hypothetical protein KAJ19_03715 [Gammaproteobacteria bacterium]|nr:hypothetical protein [Gammaproteobacteria bacterium]